jgi:hypothetical protein
MRNIIIFSLFLVFTFCSTYNSNNTGDPIAKVGDDYLYASDIPDIFTDELTNEDSVNIAKEYIQKWIKKQLILLKAELNLTADKQREVNKQLEETRTSLIIYQYEQEMIKQKLDTFVAENEIEKFYEKNSSNFVLKQNIVKALYVKLPADAPNINRVKQLYKSSNDEDLTQLESYCYQYAEKFDYFNEEWIHFSKLLNELPVTILDKERFLKHNNHIELQDSLHHYFVHLRDFTLKGTVSPLEFIQDDIKTIILTNRKIEFLKDLENNIYNDALNRNEFEIY